MNANFSVSKEIHLVHLIVNMKILSRCQNYVILFLQETQRRRGLVG